MLSVLIIYDSRTGNTEKMAYKISETIKEKDLNVLLRKVEEASIDELPKVHALILGSPVYYGLPTGRIKEFLDKSVKYHGKLTHLVGGAFCSAGGTHTGSETTIIALLESLLVHGMIIQGNPHGNHYGPAAIGSPDEKALDQCVKLGERVANLVKILNT
jgi:NAD(P)H dehydrogenase (quinone)